MNDKLKWVDLDELERLKDGLTVGYIDYWWIVNEKRQALVFDKIHPIANSDQRLVDRMFGRYRDIGATKVVQLKYASIRANVSDYV